MREGVTNKGGGLSRCAKGSQTRAGGYRAEETNRQTNKCTSKSTRMGAQKRGGGSRKRRAPRRKTSERKTSEGA